MHQQPLLADSAKVESIARPYSSSEGDAQADNRHDDQNNRDGGENHRMLRTIRPSRPMRKRFETEFIVNLDTRNFFRLASHENT